MLDRRWLHGGRRLTVAARITGCVPTLLRVWTSNPWSCPNHFSPLSVKGIAELKKNEILKILTIFPTDDANWWCFTYQWAELSSIFDQRVAGKSWKIYSKVRGDRWRPAKNSPMTKLVFLWFWMLENCSNVYLFVNQCFYSAPTE